MSAPDRLWVVRRPLSRRAPFVMWRLIPIPMCQNVRTHGGGGGLCVGPDPPSPQDPLPTPTVNNEGQPTGPLWTGAQNSFPPVLWWRVEGEFTPGHVDIQNAQMKTGDSKLPPNPKPPPSGPPPPAHALGVGVRN